ncbi:Pre-mRNA-splicing factor ISY1 [Nakaseomyces bracarensis]|uniref:Pre-mRNA-splicing factor ISY1 n=1 Tax=Nakaseomyces bracarensis TaxID=273131 RepID=A0ABR4NUD2_9SACH
MSRNSDKSRTVLTLYQEQEASGEYKEYSRYKRPKRVEQVGSLKESLEWYKQTLRDINNQSSRLYDPSLNEDQLREVNERVNVLIRESERWSRHLHKRFKHRVARRAGIYGGIVIRGTRYIGRAQELPEVQLHLKAQSKPSATRRYTIDTKRLRNVSHEYYNFDSLEIPDTLTEELQKQHNITTTSTSIFPTDIPSQEQVSKYLVQRRKKQLLEQLKL